MLVFVKLSYRFSSDFASRNGLMRLEWLKGLWSSELVGFGILCEHWSNAAVSVGSTEPVFKQGGCAKMALWQKTSCAVQTPFGISSLHSPCGYLRSLPTPYSGVSHENSHSGSTWKRGFVLTPKCYHWFWLCGAFIVNLVRYSYVNVICCLYINICLVVWPSVYSQWFSVLEG